MSKIWVLFKKELQGYFATSIAYVFIVIFLLLNGVLTFYFGLFFARGQADLLPFFKFHPWIYMIFIPAITMRLWAEEKKVGTIELLLTLPITTGQIVCAKFLSSLAFTGIALFLTFPIWIAVNYLGNPDNGVIIASYLGSFLMAGAFLAIGMCMSALTENQVVAFVLTLLICFIFNLFGFPLVIDGISKLLPPVVMDTISSFSFLTNFESISKGLIDIKSIIYFLTVIVTWLYANYVIIDFNKAD